MNNNDKMLQWGDNGMTLVFLHYFGGSAQSWRWVAEELSADFRCIALHLPGFGGTLAMEEPSIQKMAKYVQDELRALGIDRYTLIGHSMGSKIAMQVAANATEGTLQQLILVAPSPPTTEPMPPEIKEQMLNHPSVTEAEKSVSRATKQTLSARQQQLAVDTQLIIDGDTWRWWILDGMNNSIADSTRSLKVPITVLASQDDPVITPEVVDQRVMQVLDQATFVTTQQVGHLSPLEAPEWIAGQIKKIMASE